MSDAEDEIEALQRLITRLHVSNDPEAREALVAASYERLRRLASRIFHADFPRLLGQHETASILNQGVVRLMAALREWPPAALEHPTVRDYFGFAALQFRRVLYDLSRGLAAHAHRAVGPESSGTGAGYDPAETTYDPADMALWTEFHRKIEELPEGELEVVNLYFYHGLTQAQVASVMGISEKQVSRRWLSARLKMADWMPGEGDAGEPGPR